MNGQLAFDLAQLLEPDTSEPIGCVQLLVKDQYGQQVFHPANRTAEVFARIAGTKTITAPTLKLIMELGYLVEYQRPEVRV